MESSNVQPVKGMEIRYTKIFINNQFVNSISGKTFFIIDPTNEEPIAQIQEGDQADVDSAVRAARAAFSASSAWRRMDPSTRGSMLLRLADLMDRDVASLATLECMNVGKPFQEAVGDIRSAVKCIRYYGGYADKMSGRTVMSQAEFVIYTRLEPVGVCAAIVPWNFPLVMLAWKLGSALCAGCTLVVKPAEQTPLTALYMGSLLVEAGFPPGVVNIVPGFGTTAGAALAEHMDVDKITFTGSTEVGRLIMQAAAQSNLKKVTLELGGKSPLIIFPDCDLDWAVETAHAGLFYNMGECCTAASRCFVHEDIYDAFVAKAVEMARGKKVGNPFEPDVHSGPQIDAEQYSKIMHLIDSGKKEGARLMCGGKRLYDKGYFIEPTVFADVTDEMRIAKEEIFGPVQQILKFRTVDEAIERANNTAYGLAAAVITNDINKAMHISNSLQAGTVWLNCYHVISPQAPFGGYKESGFGRELGSEGPEEYCQVKTVCIKVSA